MFEKKRLTKEDDGKKQKRKVRGREGDMNTQNKKRRTAQNV
jgi:hypothetical protein